MNLDREREEEKAESKKGVTLITMHAAKGLEFPHVHIIGAEEGILPHSRSVTEGNLDEERRLFYVGITRAMRSLTITHCHTRQRYGETTSCAPSRFLKEIEGEGVEVTSSDEIRSQPADESYVDAMFERIHEMLKNA
jgi:superfamily I DNA/RNA helicase